MRNHGRVNEGMKKVCLYHFHSSKIIFWPTEKVILIFVLTDDVHTFDVNFYFTGLNSSSSDIETLKLKRKQ